MKPLLLGLSIFASLFLMGCGGAPQPKQVPVFPTEGIVNYKGKPAEGVSLRFIPDPERRDIPAISAVSGPGGKFKLTTYAEDDGAPVGTYLVGAAWTIQEPAFERDKDNQPPQKDGPKSDPTLILPPRVIDKLERKYENPRTSKIKVEIAEIPLNRLQIQLD